MRGRRLLSSTTIGRIETTHFLLFFLLLLAFFHIYSLFNLLGDLRVASQSLTSLLQKQTLDREEKNLFKKPAQEREMSLLSRYHGEINVKTRRERCDAFPPPVQARLSLPKEAKDRRGEGTLILKDVRRTEELYALLNLLNLSGKGLELGVYGAYFSFFFMQSKLSKLFLLDAKVYSTAEPKEGKPLEAAQQVKIDENMEEDVENWKYNGVVNESKINELISRSEGRVQKVTKFDSSTLEKEFPEDSLDFIFLNLHSSYEEVKKDLRLWYPKLKRGGLFAGYYYGNRYFTLTQRLFQSHFFELDMSNTTATEQLLAPLDEDKLTEEEVELNGRGVNNWSPHFTSKRKRNQKTMAVKDAVDEFVQLYSFRLYHTRADSPPSWYFRKC